MKKFSIVFMVMELLLLALMSWLFGIALAVLATEENVILSGMTKYLPIAMAVLVPIYIACVNLLTWPIAKRTMEKNAKEQGFVRYSAFINKDAFTLGSAIRIDVDTGRVAYVSFQNPFVFQLMQAEDLTNVKSGYLRGMLDTTRYVYFQFQYKNKLVRIPTFTSRRMEFVSSPLVQEGISKADSMRDLMLRQP